MSEITSLNGYKICDKQARTQVEEAVEQIEESKTQINTLSQANESALSQIENIQTQIENIQAQSAGSATKPIYFSNGEPIATTYELNATVPSGAKFTDTTYSAATTSAAGLMSASDKTKLNATTDYIIAQGTSGGWNYIKFNSGLAICSYKGSGTATHYSGPFADWFYGYTGSVPYPFTFIEAPRATFAVKIGSGFAAHCNASDDVTYLTWLALSNVSGSSTYELEAIVVGKWK